MGSLHQQFEEAFEGGLMSRYSPRDLNSFAEQLGSLDGIMLSPARGYMHYESGRFTHPSWGDTLVFFWNVYESTGQIDEFGKNDFGDLEVTKYFEEVQLYAEQVEGGGSSQRLQLGFMNTRIQSNNDGLLLFEDMAPPPDPVMPLYELLFSGLAEEISRLRGER